MLSDEIVAEMERHVQACDEARAALDRALGEAETLDSGASSEDREAVLQSVASALEDWRDAQRQFMAAVERSEAPDVATTALLLRTNEDIDSTNARRGLPGAHVDGTDQPFDLRLSGMRGQILTEAAMEHFSDAEA